MSYVNGKIYVDTSVTPNVGVSIYDVQRALGTNKNDLGQLCTHANINVWAKYKPIEFKKPNNVICVEPINDTQRAGVNWGIGDIPTWSSGSTTVSMVADYWINRSTDNVHKIPDAGNKAVWWGWISPTSAFRLTDFVSANNPSLGYFAGADAPISNLKSISGQNQGLVSVNYQLGLSGVTDGLTITFSDLTVLNTNVSYQNLYFGVIMLTGTTAYLATQSHKVGLITSKDGTSLWEQNASVNFKLSGSASDPLSQCAKNNTSFKIFPVLSSVMKDFSSTNITSQNNQTGSFVALQEAVDATVQIPMIMGDVNAIVSYKKTELAIDYYYYFTVTNTNPDSQTSNSFKITARILDASGNTLNGSAGTDGKLQGTIFNITLNGGAIWKTPKENNGDFKYIRASAGGVKFRVESELTSVAVFAQTDVEEVPITVGLPRV